MRRYAAFTAILRAAVALSVLQLAVLAVTAAESPVRQLQPIVVPPGDAATLFSERFAGNELSPAWEIVNAQPDRYLVENGRLLVVAGAVGDLGNPKSENIFRLNQPIPNSDWTITVNFDVTLQTAHESLQFGLSDDPQNYLAADVYVSTDNCSSNCGLWLRVAKVTGGQDTHFDVQAVRSGWPDLVKAVMQPVALRLTKQGHEFRAGVNLGGKLDDAGKPVWIETGSVTSLRPPKTLVLLARQREATSGESPFQIRSVVIEAPAK